MNPARAGRCASAEVPSHRVLYVDDNPDVTDSAVDLLGIVGFEARGCYDGQSALAAASDFHPGICLIDLNMPGMDGDEVARRLRERGDAQVLVAVTAMSDDRSRERMSAAGFDTHLVKPVEPGELLSVIDTLWWTWARRARTGSVDV